MAPAPAVVVVVVAGLIVPEENSAFKGPCVNNCRGGGGGGGGGGIRGRGERRGEKTITEFYCMMLFIIPVQSAHIATGPAAVLYLLNDPINIDDYHDHRNHNNSLDSTARHDTEVGKVTVIQRGQKNRQGSGRDEVEGKHADD